MRSDVDLADSNFYADRRKSHEAYRWMRANQPVFRDRNGFAGVATYHAILDAERNPELFSSAGGIRPGPPGMPFMIDMDGPAHLVRRKLVSVGFTRNRLKEKGPSIGRLCDTMIDAVSERGECDFVRDIAAPLPVAVIGDMLGLLPEERAMLLDSLPASIVSTMDVIDKRRAEPTGELFSILVNAEIDGQPMSDDEILTATRLILVAGEDTTRHALSGGIEQLLRHRDQWDALRRDPSLLPSAIEEMLRWTSPVKNMCRTLTADAEFHGTSLRKGEKIMLLFESANFDESVFDQPDNFEIRRDPNPHMAFGYGAHFCLGNQLARLELSVMIGRVLKRLPDLRLVGNSVLTLRTASFASGPESMPVVFTPSTPLAAGRGGRGA